MSTTTLAIDIKATPDKVFDAVADMDEYARAVPGVTMEGRSGQKRKGIGTRFTQIRETRGRASRMDLEVTEYQRPRLLRMTADQGGATWDTTFRVERTPTGSRLDVTLEARPHSWSAKLMVPLTKGKVAKQFRQDLDAIQAYCEG